MPWPAGSAPASTTVRVVPPPADAGPDAAPDPAAGPATVSEPLPGYDSWSLPSLRARLRTLNAAQVSALAEYERATHRREDVLTMLERRIAKLGDHGPA
jgi:hypothetical protein